MNNIKREDNINTCTGVNQEQIAVIETEDVGVVED